MIWPVSVMASMTYEIEADNPEQARERAIEFFIADAKGTLDIDTEVMTPMEE